MSELNHTIEQMNLVYIYRVTHSTRIENTFLSEVHGNFAKIDHILGYTACLKNYKGIEIISCISGS